MLLRHIIVLSGCLLFLCCVVNIIWLLDMDMNTITARDALMNEPSSHLVITEGNDECTKQFSMHWKTIGTLSPALVCHSNPAIPATACECTNCTLQTDRISMTRGHERIEDVRFRPESIELPVFRKGALQILSGHDNCSSLPGGLALEMRSLIASSSSSDQDECTTTFESPVLLVTRYEYANLWHTWTDWINLFSVIFNLGLWDNVTVIWLDGHSKSHLDGAWPLVFPKSSFKWLSELLLPSRMPSDDRFAHSYPKARLCFKRLILVPQGWMSAPQIVAEKGGPGHCQAPIITLFRHWVITQTELYKIKPNPRKVTFILRKPYLSHPRVDLNKTERVVTNEHELIQMLHALNQSHGIDADVFYAHNVSVLQQLQRMRETGGVIIGVHGAGLTNVFITDAQVLELRMGEYAARPHFELLCTWLGLRYTHWIGGGYKVDVEAIRQFIITALSESI